MTALLVTGGCTSLNIDSVGDASTRRTYVGVVTVQAPTVGEKTPTANGIRQMEISTVGLRMGSNGFGIGYLQDRLLSIPLDCRLVIFIRSTAELAHAERLLRATTKEELCTAQLFE